VPNPSPEQVDKTTQCVANCPKGNGTESDNLNYKSCVDGCIAQYYYTTTGTPNPTGGSGSGSGSGSSASGAAHTGTTTGSQTASGAQSSATTSATHNAAPILVGSSAVGLLGFFAALLAL
jgi:hypothetical protein